MPAALAAELQARRADASGHIGHNYEGPVTTAALMSENKHLANPCSTDSTPTSANQEDHVSMATFAARRLRDMNENTVNILAIEWLATSQGLDFLTPLKSSEPIEQAKAILRQQVPFYDKDRYFSPDIEKTCSLVCSGRFNFLMPPTLLPSL